MAGSSQWCQAASLQWDSQADATGWKVFQAQGLTAPFTLLGTTATPIFNGIDVSQTMRWYVTATNAVGESPPSATLTNATAPPVGILVVTAVTMGNTNVPVGTVAALSGEFRNVGGGPLVIDGGVLNILAPGATPGDGPYITVATVPAQTIAASNKVVISGSWTATTPATAGWRTYIAANVGGTWTAGPLTAFSVTAGPVNPPAAPTGLRVTAVGTTRADLAWSSDATAKTEIEERKEQDAFRRVATVAAGTHGYIRTGLRRSRDYAYRVRATRDGLVSDYSNVAVRPAM